MSKKVKKRKKQNNKKMQTKKEETSLVVVDRKKLAIANIYKKEVFKKVVKGIGIAAIGAISIAYIMLMVLVATSIFYVSHLKNGLIQRGVFVNGISVSDLTSEQAVNSVNNQLNQSIPDVINLKYKENIYEINLDELGVRFDVDSAINEAYNIGRTQNVVKDLWDYAKVINNTVNINAEFQYNDEVLTEKIMQISENLPDKVQEYSYEIKENQLIVNRGKNGVGLKNDELKSLIISNLKDRKYDEIIEIPTFETLPKDIDLQAIHNEVYTEPKDAYYTENPIKIHEQVIGVDLDVENAQNIINTSPDQEQYILNLNLTNPNIFVKDLNVFPDVLSTFCTKYVNNPNRTTNLMLAANKINGTVLMPGEKFSFNEIVGERTVAAGYKNAAIFVNGQVEDGLAGGICQVSSTLYDAVIGANLQIVERHNHSKLTSYLPGGKDATVVWGRYDFQFENTREYPIKVEMTIQNGVATATIYGIKSNDEYAINIESQRVGIKGVYTIYNAYKVYRQNGVEVKREFLSRDLYK